MVALAEVLSLSYGLRLKRSDHYRVHMKEQKKSSQARPQYSNVTKKKRHMRPRRRPLQQGAMEAEL